MTEEQVRGFFTALSNWGKWGPTDQLGALNYITPEKCRRVGTHDRKVAVLGCAGASDVLPSGFPKVTMPIHTVAIVTMGIHLIDNCNLDDVAAACATRSRWTFLCAIAPLVLIRGTASPVNPLAIF